MSLDSALTSADLIKKVANAARRAREHAKRDRGMNCSESKNGIASAVRDQGLTTRNRRLNSR